MMKSILFDFLSKHTNFQKNWNVVFSDISKKRSISKFQVCIWETKCAREKNFLTEIQGIIIWIFLQYPVTLWSYYFSMFTISKENHRNFKIGVKFYIYKSISNCMALFIISVNSGHSEFLKIQENICLLSTVILIIFTIILFYFFSKRYSTVLW